MVCGIKRELQPTQIFIPPRMITVVIGNESGSKISIKPFGMGRLRIIRGSRNMTNAPGETHVAELA
jgi:hypothetical protein